MVEQIKKLCSDNRTSIKALEKELGFGNGTIRRWDKHTPSFERIVLVANRFNVPVAYLTEDVDDPFDQSLPHQAEIGSSKKEKPALQAESELSPIKQQVWELLNSMSDERLEKALAILKTVSEM